MSDWTMHLPCMHLLAQDNWSWREADREHCISKGTARMQAPTGTYSRSVSLQIASRYDSAFNWSYAISCPFREARISRRTLSWISGCSQSSCRTCAIRCEVVSVAAKRRMLAGRAIWLVINVLDEQQRQDVRHLSDDLLVREPFRFICLHVRLYWKRIM